MSVVSAGAGLTLVKLRKLKREKEGWKALVWIVCLLQFVLNCLMIEDNVNAQTRNASDR